MELAEWQTATPDNTPALAGLSLPDGVDARATLTYLNERQIISIRELRTGLEISTSSFVGSLSLGSVTLRIQPKLEPESFAVLVGYALRLPDIELFQAHTARLAAPAYQDLLVARLAEEASRILARGIYRHYKKQEAALGSPKGRLLFGRIARGSASVSPTLPCQFYEREEDVLPNRVLLSGLRLAVGVSIDASVRQSALRPLAALAERVRPVQLSAAVLADLDRSKSRLLAMYEPAIALIRLLMAGRGIGTHYSAESFPLPGFLFDMNYLFQQALGRFLKDSLEDIEVHEQYPVAELFAYQSLFNPRRKRPPTPRPDYVFTRRRKVIGIADAKYRDLWEHDLGRDMLYQLTIYALSQTDCRVATIIYPASDPAAREARIAIQDPTSGQMRGEIHLRPVNIRFLAELIRTPATAECLRQRKEYAERLAFLGGR